MGPIGVTASRTFGRMRNLYSTALALAVFLMAAGISFAFNLERNEGGLLAIAPVWALSISMVLPLLPALLAMDVWSEERSSGRIEQLLSLGVKESQYVLGKFLGVWVAELAAVVLALVISLSALRFYAPSSLGGVRLVTFLPGLLALSLQGALWAAVVTATSSWFYRGTAAIMALAISVAIPRALWFALLRWSELPSLGEMPLDAHVLDMAMGLVSSGVVIGYLLATTAFLVLCVLAIAVSRYVSRGGAATRFLTMVTAVLTLVAAGLATVLAMRLEVMLDLNVGSGELSFSARTRNILADAQGNITATCFLPRHDPRFRSTAHFLRALSREAEGCAGVTITVRYVDPRWDFGAAARLVRMGVKECSIVFEKGRRVVAIPVDEGRGERVAASAILQLSAPPHRRCVYWTVGHGEYAFGDYGGYGMSDIAREFQRDGYRNAELNLDRGMVVPADCAFVVIAGAKADFSRLECEWIDDYLRKGGRLLMLLNGESGGAASILPAWGVRPEEIALVGARTLSGGDVIASEFSDHAIAAPLKGAQIVLERPLALQSTAVADFGDGADRIDFSPLVSAGDGVVAAVVERGAKAGSDTTIRPTRIVVIGDSSFVLNGQLAMRANANRDFMLNCAAYLSGTDAITAGGVDAGVLVTGMDRSSRGRFAFLIALWAPLFMMLVMASWVFARRHRK